MALNNLGVTLAASGRHEEAIVQYKAVLALKPDYPEAVNNFGTALHASGRPDEAIAQFRAAVALRPEFADARANLGHALAGLDLIDDAVSCYRSVLQLQPHNAGIHLNLADLLFKQQEHDNAILHYGRALAAQPDLADAHAGLGAVLQELGHLEEAKRCFERAITINPLCVSHYARLVRNVRLVPEDPNFTRLLDLARDMASLGDEDRTRLHFVLGKALADAGRPELAFDHLIAANKLKRRLASHDEKIELGQMDRVRSVFTEDMMRTRRHSGVMSQTPVFIVGMPRSGSTLVEQILASHPNVFGAGELTALYDAMRASGVHKAPSKLPETVPLWRTETLRGIGDRYLRRLQSLCRDDGPPGQIERITDRMPSNFSYIGLIRLVLPNATIIHTHRNPIDTCLSCFSLEFEGLDFTYDLGELGRRYRGYASLMQHWHRILPPGAILDVQYENVVADLETEARRGSSPTADWRGTVRASTSTRPNGPCGPRASSRCASRFTVHLSGAGARRPICCVRSWKGSAFAKSVPGLHMLMWRLRGMALVSLVLVRHRPSRPALDRWEAIHLKRRVSIQPMKHAVRAAWSRVCISIHAAT